MIVLPPTTAPAPNGGTNATDTDGTDPGLSAMFASLVAALLNPQGQPTVTADAPTQASSSATAAVTGIAATATATAAPGTAVSTGTIASSLFAGATPDGQTDLAAIGTPIASMTTPDASATTPIAIDAASALSTAAAAIGQAAVNGGTVAIDAAPTAQPAAAPALSAATVIQARQPGQPSQADVVVDDEPVLQTAQGQTVESSPTTAPAAAATAAEEEVDDEGDVDAASNHVAVEMADQQPQALGHVAATSKTHVTAPATAVEPHQQIAAVVSPLRRQGDGSYRLTLHIKPEQLGNVDLHVDLHHGTIDLHMHTDNEQAREAIANRLDDLRAELERAGLKAGSFDVGTGDDRRQPGTNTRTVRPTITTVTAAGEAEPAAPATVSKANDDTAIDVRV